MFTNSFLLSDLAESSDWREMWGAMSNKGVTATASHEAASLMSIVQQIGVADYSEKMIESFTITR